MATPESPTVAIRGRDLPHATDRRSPEPQKDTHTSTDTATQQEITSSETAPQEGWGWSGWLPTTAALQQAAAGAFRDVQELKESLQQVLSLLVAGRLIAVG
jgi:hypothetical protein